MDTRLDNLFALLDKTSSNVTRKLAAEQIGRIQRSHPNYLQNLLERTHRYLVSEDWDSRCGAAATIGAIVCELPDFEFLDKRQSSMDKSTAAFSKMDGNDGSSVKIEKQVLDMEDDTRLLYKTFNFKELIESGKRLLGSSGEEYDVEIKALSPEELREQRSMINDILGDVVAASYFTDEDLKLKKQEESKSVCEIEVASKNVSSRMRNLMKRRQKTSSNTHVDSNCESMNSDVKVKTQVTDQSDANKVVLDTVIDVDRAFENFDEWPLERFSNELCNELFDHRWYVRHGAASGLLEIFSKQATMAGKRFDQSHELQTASNLYWLEDFSIRLLCVLILDRFQDYSFSVPVSPVRETCAMVLGCIIKVLSQSLLESLFQTLLLMCNETESWQVITGLQDEETEVQGVASAALLPLVNSSLLDTVDLQKLSIHLWNNLNYLDDLSSSTVSIMGLISSMASAVTTVDDSAQYPVSPGNTDIPPGEAEFSVYDYHVAEILRQKQLQQYFDRGFTVAKYSEFQNDPHLKIPYLFPFFRSHSKEVRLAVLSTIKSLIIANIKIRDQWLPSIAYRLFFLTFQNFVLEVEPEVLRVNRELWKLILLSYPSSYTEVSQGIYECVMSSEYTAQWYDFFCIENGEKIPLSKILSFTSDGQVADTSDDVGGRANADNMMYISIAMALSDMLYLIPEVIPAQLSLICCMLNSSSATQILCASLTILYWAEKYETKVQVESYLTPELVEGLSQLVEAPVSEHYKELQGQLNQIISYLQDYLSLLKKIGIEFQLSVKLESLTLDQSIQLLEQLQPVLQQISSDSIKKKIETQNHVLTGSIGLALGNREQLVMRSSSTLSAAVISCKTFPQKLLKIINPLMKSAKSELEFEMQKISCNALANLIYFTHKSHPVPCKRVLEHVAVLLHADFYHLKALKLVRALYELLYENPPTSKNRGNQIEIRSAKQAKFQEDIPETYTPSEDFNLILDADDTVIFDISKPDSVEENPYSGNQFCGGETCFKTVVHLFGSKLFDLLPDLWDMIETPVTSTKQVEYESLKKSLLVASVLAEGFHSYEESLPNHHLLSLIPKIKPFLNDRSMTIQALAAHCIASIIKGSVPESILSIMTHIVPALNDVSHVRSRRGAALVLDCIIDQLELEVLPYLIFLMTSTMARMSDQDVLVRKIISHSFARLVQLMPLERDVPNPPGMPEHLVQQRKQERDFLEQFLGGKKPEQFLLPVAIKAELRGYQQDGVNWLAFLNKYSLHGILADDMGLGKTLQTLCIIFSDFVLRAEKFKNTLNPEYEKLPSIIVCPSILVSHWDKEIEKFSTIKFHVLQYVGNSAERAALSRKFRSADIVIVSYEKLRSDLDQFLHVQFHYCVLDEGHLIKNPASKISQSVKKIKCNRRLLLSGTPIQNNLLELWSLFDFLMPGFLGTEQQFFAAYSKPVMLSKNPKSTTEQQNAGLLALEALHRQVLPFILRRMKTDVLSDLPPKIVQDITVDLSPVQQMLYENFTKTNIVNVTQDSVHVFQSLHYLRSLCSHPKLVFNKNSPLYANVMTYLKTNNLTLDDISMGSKVAALQETLVSSGIGIGNVDTQTDEISQNRVLIFVQLKSMLDIIENDLFKRHMPRVSYLRLDGGVPTNQRMGIVDKFNSDPSIDVLLLTVSVGGLGLNLTGANVVIFVEHDWNPQNDIQAMDRVHRIGQVKTVNVYRLITRNTIEEKIMGLQKFKLSMANSVVNCENQSFRDMDTSQIFNLFKKSEHSSDSNTRRTANSGIDEFGNITTSKSKNSDTESRELLERLDEMAQSTRYAEEYSMENFLSKIK